MQNLREKAQHVFEILIIMCPVSHAGSPNPHLGNIRKLIGDDVISAKRQAKGRFKLLGLQSVPDVPSVNKPYNLL